MARRRFQATGHLYESPSGEWRHQHWADVIDDRGKRVPKRRDERVGPAKGPGKMTRKQAWAHVQQHILPRVNAERQQAESGLTLAGFVEARFLREYVSRKRPATQIHYAQRLKHDILPVLGGMLLADIEYSHILECVYRVTERGRSTQTAAHVRNCLSAIFKHAKLSGHFHGENPARLVESPEIMRRDSYAYSWAQVNEVLLAVPKPWELAVRLAILTGLRVGEIRGLRWMRLNLSDGWVVSGGENLPPLSLAVREQFGIGGYVALKNKGSRRLIPLAGELGGVLAAHKAAGSFDGPEHPVFSNRAGAPFDAHNVSNRVFRPLAKSLRYPVAWHVFRHTHATLMDQVHMPLAARMAGLGHSSAKMTMHYTHGDLDDQRRAAEAMAGMLGSGVVQ